MKDIWADMAWETLDCGPLNSDSAWHKHLVPYQDDANALQTMDIWLPKRGSIEAPPAGFLPTDQRYWVIYIHGGAWRDPLVSASSFESTAKLILSNSKTVEQIAGLASLNYSLSPHPHHPTDPSPPTDPSKPADPSREAKHPDHIRDVLTALSFLQQKAGFQERYVLIGHSCGATLALQVAMKNRGWGLGSHLPRMTPPSTIIGLNGLYDLPALISDPGEKHKQFVPIYEAFTKLAFGEDKDLWREVSPAYMEDWMRDWPEGQKAVFAQSHADTLVPYKQTDDMMKTLIGSSKINVEEVAIEGDHNDIWQNGERLADIVHQVLSSLEES